MNILIGGKATPVGKKPGVTRSVMQSVIVSIIKNFKHFFFSSIFYVLTSCFKCLQFYVAVKDISQKWQ